MKEIQPPPLPIEALKQKWEVQEHSFVSHTPVIGPLIVALRTAWNKVATKWYVTPLLRQQNEFNAHTVQQFIQQWNLMEHQQAWLIAQGQEQDELVHDLGEIGIQIRQLQQQLTELSDRLDHLKK